MNAPRKRRQRSVATRILSSYLVVLCLFAAASAWSVVTFREAVSETTLLRQGYLPLALSLRDLVSNQDTWNSQLNHVTAARNPEDARVWFETAVSLGRPKKFSEVDRALSRALFDQDPGDRLVRSALHADLARVRYVMRPDADALKRMFAALGRGDAGEAQTLRDELVNRGLRVQRNLGALERRVTSHVDDLARDARERERTALLLLSILGGLALLVGILMALYAQRVLRPLSQVTARADAVAAGDLSTREAIDTGDEIGELSATFEGMVRAIAETREKLLATERLAAIGKMAAHVTHEVRNPLSSIALNLDLLEEELEGGEEEPRVLLRAIGQEVNRLSALSDQYLSMAKRKAPELSATDMSALLTDAIHFMRPELEGHGVHIELSFEAELPWVNVDQGQMRQVLFNLARNAREAMPEGGKIFVQISRSVGESEHLLVQVTDTGPGVPEDQVAQLFDPFFTTKSHGTGLGLAVTAQILAAHGGKISYEPAVPHGSQFSLRIPIGESSARETYDD